uniref:Galactosidase, beta 1-like n=1 Tax=Labrus bergylta TaxID=56723 RepID=A0A3Q3GBR6_9LABR
MTCLITYKSPDHSQGLQFINQLLPLYYVYIVGKFTLNEMSFSIDYKNNCFLKDGKPFQYISGSIHYSRIPRYYWKDRLMKMYMTGLNAIQVLSPGSQQLALMERESLEFSSMHSFFTENNIAEAFKRQRRFEPRGPLVNSEFYTGWLDHWGDQHAVVNSQKVSRVLGEMLTMGANVNMYVSPHTLNVFTRSDLNLTSYDYDAPLSEAGDPTEKLLAIRDVIKQFRDIPSGPMPPATPKFAYGFVTLKKVNVTPGLILASLKSQHPLTFEEMKQFYGYMLYRTRLPRDLPQPTPLISPLNGVHDRAYVSINGVYQGLLERDTVLVTNVTAQQGDTLDILVENMGRVNFGSRINDFKGLLSDLFLGKDLLTDWLIYPLDIDGAIASDPSVGPIFYSGTLQPNGLSWDTFLKLNGWTKGQVWINGMNLGRYWPARGPQQTLYVPGPLLSTTQPNNITVLELEGAPAHLRVLFMDRPDRLDMKPVSTELSLSVPVTLLLVPPPSLPELSSSESDSEPEILDMSPVKQ